VHQDEQRTTLRGTVEVEMKSTEKIVHERRVTATVDWFELREELESRVARAYSLDTSRTTFTVKIERLVEGSPVYPVDKWKAVIEAVENIGTTSPTTEII
jgi:hypothetical protein